MKALSDHLPERLGRGERLPVVVLQSLDVRRDRLREQGVVRHDVVELEAPRVREVIRRDGQTRGDRQRLPVHSCPVGVGRQGVSVDDGRSNAVDFLIY